MIDKERLPKTAMVDTGVFLRFLGARPGDPEAPICRAFCEAMLEGGNVLYVAAPTLAEIIRKNGERAPRIKGVVVVPFDDRAAEILGAKMPLPALRAAMKVDAMIMACAARSKTATLVTLDLEDMLPLGAGLAIAVQRPQDFASEQLALPGMIEAEALAASEPVETMMAMEALEVPEAPEPAPAAAATKQLQLPW